ncbi:MAG TPA: helix-turn-helix domain-containing protein [Firmicutes bacterium]|nr:helix-turn-helix domain-containing protein [Bacillota bacterium]
MCCRWNEEDQARLAELIQDKLTYEEIARRLGRSKATVWRAAARMRGMVPAQRGERIRRWTPEEKQMLVDLHARGWSDSRIAKRLNRTESAVRAAIAKHRKVVMQDPQKRLVMRVLGFCSDPLKILKAARDARIVDELSAADSDEAISKIVSQVRSGW